ncbi:HAAS signaling domain-containing protein [Streptomyces cyaneofuscatus]|uniref:HAAS signaling domain-containing protein n=1 Tax=Streptomyces cyaneofuscatus TaxID=66883 RepID=UPI00365ECA64
MSTNTLTERYVHEVVRRLPADQRDDIADELRTTIADTIEARDPARPETVEREVLSEMGDPIRHAARYADRPLALIGPDLYPTYIRLLAFLLTTVLPVITAVFVLLEIVDGNGLGAAVGAGVETVFTVGAQMVTVLTVLFAVAERAGHRKGTLIRTTDWTPDDLPETREPQKVGVGAVLTAVWYALLLGLTVWQQLSEPYRTDGGERIPVLDPDLWSGWIWPILIGLAGLVVLALVRVVTHGWTSRLAVLHAIAQAVFVLPLAWILQQRQIFNPDFLADVTDNTTPEVYTGAALIVLVASLIAVVNGFRAAKK